MNRGPGRRVLRRCAVGLSVVAAVVLGALTVGYLYIARDLPDVRPLREPEGIRSFMELPLDFKPLRFAELPPHLGDAFMAVCGDSLQSQLARRLLFDGPHGLSADRRRGAGVHVYAGVLSLHMDALLSREEIFAAWLNGLYFGHHAYGPEAAARVYFGKPAHAVTLDEAALLAALSYAPTDLDPEALRRRRERVLTAMRERGDITPEACRFAALMPIIPPVPLAGGKPSASE